MGEKSRKGYSFKIPLIILVRSMGERKRGRRKVMIGTVVSNKMDKTVVVAVEERVRHPIYGKFMSKKSKYKAHDEKNECVVGDKIEIEETRPLSKEKRWRVKGVVEKAL